MYDMKQALLAWSQVISQPSSMRVPRRKLWEHLSPNCDSVQMLRRSEEFFKPKYSDSKELNPEDIIYDDELYP